MSKEKSTEENLAPEVRDEEQLDEVQGGLLVDANQTPMLKMEDTELTSSVMKVRHDTAKA